MLHRTLSAMAAGGMYDHVEGGFFRYSTTREWGIPHYEKMLEDNAELLTIYAEAHRSFPSAGYDRVAGDVARWMDATLWREDVNAFAGSQDADEHYYTLDSIAERAQHDAPFVDRTIYSGWNALAASAYLSGAAALDDDRLKERGHEAIVTIAHMSGPDGNLPHFDGGQTRPEVVDLLGDLAALCAAMLDVYETGAHPHALLGARMAAESLRDKLL